MPQINDFIFLAYLDRLDRKLDLISSQLTSVISIQTNQARQLESEMKEIMADLTQLEQAVQNEANVEQSAIVLIQGLADQLKQVATDPAKVQALADQINSSAQALAAAVSANTPAEA